MSNRQPGHASVREPPTGFAAIDSLGGIDARAIVSLAVRRWPVVAGVVLAAMMLAFVWLLQVTPIFTATTQLLIDTRQQRMVRSDTQYDIALSLEAGSIATEVALIRSFSVARRVAERLHLDAPQADPSDGKDAGLLTTFRTLLSLRGTDSARAPPVQAVRTRGELTPQLLGAIGRVQSGTAVQRMGTTYFIEVSHSDPDPKVAARIANAVAAAYLDEQLEARYDAAKRVAGWLSERLAALRTQLEASERAVAQHRAKYNLVSPKGGTISEQQAAEINAQLVSARAQTVEKKAKYEQAQKILKGGAGIETVAAVMDSPVIAALRQQDATLGRLEADQLTRYGPEHPAIIKLRAERADLRRQIGREVSRLVQTLKTDFEFSLRKEQSLQSSLDELTGSDTRDDQVVIRLHELERDAQSNRVLYDTMLARFKEVEHQATVSGPETRIVAPALAPGGPSYPNYRRTLMLAMFAGLALGFGAALLLEYVENGFATMEQAEQALGLPVLAMVPQIVERERKVDGKLLPIPDYVVRRPLSRFGESIRSVRVGTQMSDIDRPPRLVLVTSAAPSEGKTTVALSMACSAAAAGQRVLVMDCDLRHPSASKYFGLEKAPGLTDLLLGDATPEQVFVASQLASMTVIPAGTSTRHPPDILGSDRMRALLQKIAAGYDAVYIDAPPISPVIDSPLLATLVDKVVFVVRWRSTPREVVRRAIQDIDHADQKIAGIVLNNTQVGRLSSYGSYYSYYGRKYHNYYSS